MAVPSKNYRELMSAIPDIHEANYPAFYTQFGADANQPTPAMLTRTVLEASNTYPKVFVKATVVNNAIQIRCILRPTRYHAPLGVTSAHEGILYGLNGDLSSQGLPSLAVWPPQGFHRCTAATIYTVDEVNAQFLATPGLQVIAPLVAGALNTEQGQCRYLCPLPSKYAALALRKQKYTPNEFWHDIVHPIIADGNTVPCSELLLWARLALHQHAMADGTVLFVNASDALTAPVADAELMDWVSGWIQSDLPDRMPQANAVAVQQQLITQQQLLTTLVANQQVAAAAMNQPKRKMVIEAFPAFIDMLLKYCDAINEAALPPIYEQMANCKRSEQVTLVQYHLALRADQVGWGPPIASPELVEAMFRMAFTSPDVDNLTGGINVFHIIPANDSRAGEIRERQNVYSMVFAGSVAPTIEQLNRLVDTAPQMARDLVSLLTTFRAYSVVLDVVFGTDQLLAVAFRNFVRRWELEAQSVVHMVFSADEIPALMPLVQRRVQLENQYWMNQVALLPPGEFPPLPEYGSIIRDVQMRNWNTFQAIPARYTQRPLAPPPSLPSLNAGGPPSGRAPPPALAPSAGPAPRPPAVSTAVSNPTPNVGIIERYGRYGGRLRTLTARLRSQLPMADDGTQLCLAYCLTGHCNTNCHRRVTHRPLTTTEEGRVAAFLTAGEVE
jgi:hypothetical protein